MSNPTKFESYRPPGLDPCPTCGKNTFGTDVDPCRCATEGLHIEGTIPWFAQRLGEMPDGDVPAAWYGSLQPEVLSGWDEFTEAERKWRSTYSELLDALKLPAPTLYMKAAKSHFIGIVPPSGVEGPPRWLHLSPKGYWVPRKRTRAEKISPVTEFFAKLESIPQAEDYLPGMPTSLWTPSGVYPVHCRKPAQAVLAFLGITPDDADPPFAVDDTLWTRMKMSTYWLLRERQVVTKFAEALQEKFD